MGGGSFDVYRVSEQLARIDVGVAVEMRCGSLENDVIARGGTDQQRKDWLTRIANEGLLFAYGATEPAAGSDLGSLRTTATPVIEDGVTVGYRISGQKQWISNGGIAAPRLPSRGRRTPAASPRRSRRSARRSSGPARRW